MTHIHIHAWLHLLLDTLSSHALPLVVMVMVFDLYHIIYNNIQV